MLIGCLIVEVLPAVAGVDPKCDREVRERHPKPVQVNFNKYQPVQVRDHTGMNESLDLICLISWERLYSIPYGIVWGVILGYTIHRVP
jgi:hypothetical protein